MYLSIAKVSTDKCQLVTYNIRLNEQTKKGVVKFTNSIA